MIEALANLSTAYATIPPAQAVAGGFDLAALLNSPLALLLLGAAGWEWARGRNSHTKSVQIDADVLARLKNVETWQSDHNTIHGCVRELSATVKGMCGQIDRLTNRLDYWMRVLPSPPPPPSRPTRGPFDHEMGDWVRDQ